MRKKLLMTASTFAHIRNFHLSYLKGFHDLGWEVHVACGGVHIDIPYVDRLIDLPLKKHIGSLDNLRAMCMLRSEMKHSHYDLVITHTSLASFFTRLALLIYPQRARCCNVVHGYLFDDRGNPLLSLAYQAAEYIVSSVTDQILTMNQYDFEWTKKHFPHKLIKNIPGMGVDEARVAEAHRHGFGFSEGSVVLIFPAEFSERKNQAMLVRAMPCLPEYVKLVLPGDGALLQECKTLTKELGVAQRVLFPGYVKEPIPLLKGADIAVSSSRFEGLPFNIIEAMQCGLPIVASRVKGNSDLVEEGVNGFLYDCDDVDGFVQAVNRLLADERMCQKMRKNGRAMVSQYELDTVYPQVMALYLGEQGSAERSERERLGDA